MIDEHTMSEIKPRDFISEFEASSQIFTVSGELARMIDGDRNNPFDAILPTCRIIRQFETLGLCLIEFPEAVALEQLAQIAELSNGLSFVDHAYWDKRSNLQIPTGNFIVTTDEPINFDAVSKLFANIGVEAVSTLTAASRSHRARLKSTTGKPLFEIAQSLEEDGSVSSVRLEALRLPANSLRRDLGGHQEIVALCRRRGQLLRYTSWALILMIFAALGGGLRVFFLADELAKSDFSEKVNDLAEISGAISSELQTLEATLNERNAEFLSVKIESENRIQDQLANAIIAFRDGRGQGPIEVNTFDIIAKNTSNVEALSSKELDIPEFVRNIELNNGNIEKKLIISDLNGDGFDDIIDNAINFTTSSQFTIYFSTGDGGFVKRDVRRKGLFYNNSFFIDEKADENHLYFMYLSDRDDVGKRTPILSRIIMPIDEITEGNAIISDDILTLTSLNELPTDYQIADIDGDGFEDLVATGYDYVGSDDGERVTIYRNFTSSAQPSPISRFYKGRSFNSRLTLFDNDGNDIVILIGNDRIERVLLNNSTIELRSFSTKDESGEIQINLSSVLRPLNQIPRKKKLAVIGYYSENTYNIDTFRVSGQRELTRTSRIDARGRIGNIFLVDVNSNGILDLIYQSDLGNQKLSSISIANPNDRKSPPQVTQIKGLGSFENYFVGKFNKSAVAQIVSFSRLSVKDSQEDEINDIISTSFKKGMQELKDLVEAVDAQSEISTEDFRGSSDKIATLFSLFNDEKISSRIDAETNIQLATSISYRIGILAATFFLVQILVVTYRYTLKLSYFFDARADALVMSDGRTLDEYRSLLETLAPENLDFGKSPSSPISHVIEAAKVLGKSSGRSGT